MSGNTGVQTVYLVEIQAYTGATTETLYFSDGGYTTKPTDTPANVFFEPVIEDPGSYAVSVFSGGATGGDVEVGYGTVRLANPDGGLDALRTYGYGRTITIKSITARNPRDTAYSEASTRFVGVVDHVEADFDTLDVVIRDELALLDKPYTEARFAGTATGASTIEGNANVEGVPKPTAFGYGLRNISPVLANASNEIYAFGFNTNGSTVAANAVNAVRNAGATYTKSGVDRANLAAMEATAPTAAQADTCLAESLVRLNGSVTGAITLDVDMVTAASATAARVVEAILADHGYTLSSGTVASLDAKNSSPVGVYGAGGETILDLCVRALESVGGYLVPSGTPGVFTLGRFEAPSGSPVLAIEEWQIIEDGSYRIALLPTDDDRTGIPAYRLTGHYNRNWTVASPGELAGSVSQDDRADYREEWRKLVLEDATVKTKHPEARELEIYMHFASTSAASTETDRRLDFFKADNLRLRVPLATDLEGVSLVSLGDYVTLTHSRFGLSGGGNFVVVGIEESFADGVTVLDIVNSGAW